MPRQQVVLLWGHSLVQVQLSMPSFPFPVHHSLLSMPSSLCPPPHT